jgi:hypothetical protein
MGIRTYIHVHPVDVGDTTSLIFSSVKGGQFKKIILVYAGVSFFKTPTFVFFPHDTRRVFTGSYWIF